MSLDELLKRLASPHPFDAFWAIQSIARTRRAELLERVPALLELLKHPNAPTRLYSIMVLVHVRASNATPALIDALDDENANVRRMAASALLGFGKYGVEDVPRLVSAINGNDCQVDVPLARAILSLVPRHETALQALRAGLYEHEANISIDAANALAEAGVDAVPDLTAAIAQAEPRVLPYLYQALHTATKDAAVLVPLLTDALTFRENESARPRAARETALDLLAKLGSQAVTAAPAVCANLNDPSPRLRQTCIRTLERIEAPADIALEVVIGALGDRDDQVAIAAAILVGRWGAKARTAAPRLRELATNARNSRLRRVCAASLEQIQRE